MNWSREKRSAGPSVNQIDARVAAGGARIRVRVGLPRAARRIPNDQSANGASKTSKARLNAKGEVQ